MKIGIVSDLHGYPETFRKTINYLKGSSMILCAGDILYHGPRNPILNGYDPKSLAEDIKKLDIPMLIARGNCDAEVDMMVLDMPIITPYIVYEKDGIRFMVTHGHDVTEDKLHDIVKFYKVDIMITGHTHIRKAERYEKTLIINPGSISVPKGDGRPSFAVFEDNTVKFINVNNGEEMDRIIL